MENKKGRPSKIARFTEVAEQVLFDDTRRVGAAIVHTDSDLIELINEHLEPDERIAEVTFKKWKAGEATQDDTLRECFLSLYKRALKLQRDQLFESLADEPPGAWQKWAWILERKFGDWNLRSVTVDETPQPKQLVLRVKGG
jgi:hypothetical protein